MNHLMRGKRRNWVCLSLLAAAGLILWLGYQRRSGEPLAPVSPPIARPGTLAAPAPLDRTAPDKTLPPASLRLANTRSSPGQLLANPRAILLENALFDTALPVVPPPLALRTKGDSGTYIVQSRRPPGRWFRTLLTDAGAAVVAYIPNRAYLVRAPRSVARFLEASPLVQSVLPYEPYYKLKAELLALGVEGRPMAPETRLRVVLFADSEARTRQDLEALGAVVIAEDQSPFGPTLELRFPRLGNDERPGLLAGLACLPGIQEIEPIHPRLPANDLVRATTGIAPTSIAATNYLNLTGANVLVEINDTGVDATHPDLAGRVSGDSTNSLTDFNGHGTHVAGIIAGSGQDSTAVTNAAGSLMPAVPGQFRGMAPSARLFATAGGTDTYLQQAAASTQALISNNSWTYASGGYDLAAASYDAAVRNASPAASGSQSVLFVFAAGNAGGGQDDGTGGQANSILSPATAKNVITVGALEAGPSTDGRGLGLLRSCHASVADQPTVAPAHRHQQPRRRFFQPRKRRPRG